MSSSASQLPLNALDSPPITLPESRQTHSDDAGTPSNPSTDIPGVNKYAYSDLITRRIAHLQSLSSSLHHYHAYRETLPAIIDAYKSGNLTIERGQLTFWARGCQLGPARKFEIPTTEDESLRQQVRVMGMLDEVLKVQDRGDLLWIENDTLLDEMYQPCRYTSGKVTNSKK